MPTQGDFKKFGKSGFGKGSNLFGKAKSKEAGFRQLPTMQEDIDQRPDKEKEWARTLEDDELAKRVYSLWLKWPDATLPELVVWLELKKRNIVFDYQVQILGGRRIRGSLTPDFVIKRGGTGLVIEVNGTYWHEGAEKEEKDRGDLLRMIGVTAGGVKITQAVTVWDVDLYPSESRRRTTMENALLGIEL